MTGAKQTKIWSGQFGKEYTDRNARLVQEMELSYKKRYGITRTEMNDTFVGDFSRDISIMEVGSNIGTKLLCLQNAGFENLCGIELQSYAVKLSKGITRGINMVQGSAFNIPFKDKFFDLVFTSGLLIHIAHEDITSAMDEIYRCTKQYIWCFEYFSEEYTQIDYRGHANLLWKANFSRLFMDRFKDLRLIREEHFKYLNGDNDNIDTMFLLQRGK